MKLVDVKCKTDSVLYAIPERLAVYIQGLPVFMKNSIREIRLRCGGPLCITTEATFYISEDGGASSYLPSRPVIVSRQEIDEVIKRITGSSVYAREQELKEGYLSMKQGNRAGVSGSFSGGKFRRANAINIRIARQVKGCAEPLKTKAENGILIVGRPGSGKTTLLRDLVRLLSSDGHRVAVIDTRGELCGEQGQTLDVGPNTDIINGTSKAEGCEMALRTLNPEYIAFDEVGNGRELALISESFFSGVKILTTAHGANMNDIKSRSVTSALLNGSIGKIALIEGAPGSKITVLTLKEVLKSD